MAIRFYVEDQLHNRRETFSDGPENPFLTLARRLARDGSRVFDIIDPYADAMFNYIQLERMINELEDALQRSIAPSERDMALKVQHAAREARNLSGYLFIEGD
ncbi:hypothetical protein ACQSSU_03790 [Micromonospora echinospora]